MSKTATSIVREAFIRKIGDPTDSELWAESRFTQFEKDACVSRLLTWVALYDHGQMIWNHSPGALHTMLNAAPALCTDLFPGRPGRKALSTLANWDEVFSAAEENYMDILQRTLAPSMYWNLSRSASGKADETHFANGKVTPRDKAIYAAMCCLMSEGRLTQEVEAGRHLALYRALQEDLPSVEAAISRLEAETKRVIQLCDIQGCSVLSGFSGPIVEEVIAKAAQYKEKSEKSINLPIVNNLRQLQATSFDRRQDEDPLAFIQRTPWGQHIYAKGISPYASMYKIDAEELAGEAVRAVVEGYNYYVPITLASYSVRDATKKDKLRQEVASLAPDAKQLDMFAGEVKEPEPKKQSKGYTWFICPAPSGSIEAQIQFRLGEEVDRIKAGGMKNSLQDNPDVLLLRRDSITLQKQNPDLEWASCVALAKSDINVLRQNEGEQKIRDEVQEAIDAMPIYKPAQKLRNQLETDIFERAVAHHMATKEEKESGVPDLKKWGLCLQAAQNQVLSSFPDFSLSAKVTNYVRDGNPSIISLDAPRSTEGDRTGHEMVGENLYEANPDDLEPKGPDDVLARIGTSVRYEYGFGEEPTEASRSHVLSNIVKEARDKKHDSMLDFMQSLTRNFDTFPTQKQVDSMLGILDETYTSANQENLAFLKRGTMAIRMALDMDPSQDALKGLETENPARREIKAAALEGRTVDQKFTRALAVAAKTLVTKAPPEELIRQMQNRI